MHFDMPADDMARATTFFSNVFGWKFDTWGDGSYQMANTGEAAEPGINGGEAGDLYLRVRHAAHPDFTTREADVLHELDISPWEAALGAEVLVPTLDGSIKLRVPAVSENGELPSEPPSRRLRVVAPIVIGPPPFLYRIAGPVAHKGMLACASRSEPAVSD